jgi:hypothetical protein
MTVDNISQDEALQNVIVNAPRNNKQFEVPGKEQVYVDSGSVVECTVSVIRVSRWIFC